MKEIKQYLTHCSGFYSFISWLDEQKRSGLPFEVLNNIIYLNPLFSQYISMGASTLKRNNGEAFLAISSQEAKWMSMIKWSEVVFRKEDNYIYILSPGVESSTSQYPDIPGFALGFYVDLKEKISLLHNLHYLTIREYRLEDDNGIYINYHSRVCKLPVKLIEENMIIENENSLKNYDTFISTQIEQMTSYGNRFTPTY